MVDSPALAKFLTSRGFDGKDGNDVEWTGSRFPGCTQVEIIMMWAESHPNMRDQLLKTLLLHRDNICYRVIPKNYERLVMRPYVANLLGREILK